MIAQPNSTSTTECPRPPPSCFVGASSYSTRHDVFAYLTLISGVLSCLGALLIMWAFYSLKHTRNSIVMKIIVCIAASDLLHAISFMMGAINYLVFYRSTEDKTKCELFQAICASQGFLLVTSGWNVYVWNSLLAIHFFMLYYWQKATDKIQRCLYKNNIITCLFVLPLGVSTIAAGILVYLSYFGPAFPYLCLIIKKDLSPSETFAIILFAAWIPELVSYVVILFVYTPLSVHLLIHRYHLWSINRKQKSLLQTETDESKLKPDPSATHDGSQASQQSNSMWRFCIIPVVFIGLRIWDAVEAGLTSQGNYDPCSDVPLEVFSFFQVTGDISQGWVNALIFILLSKDIRNKLFRCTCKCLSKKPRGKSSQNVQTNAYKCGPEQTDSQSGSYGTFKESTRLSQASQTSFILIHSEITTTND